jgi:hypothetical protein
MRCEVRLDRWSTPSVSVADDVHDPGEDQALFREHAPDLIGLRGAFVNQPLAHPKVTEAIAILPS